MLVYWRALAVPCRQWQPRCAFHGWLQWWQLGTALLSPSFGRFRCPKGPRKWFENRKLRYGSKNGVDLPWFSSGQNKPNGFCDTFFLDNPIIYCTSLRCDRLWWSLWFRHASFQVAMNFWHCWLFPTCQVRVSRFCQSYFPSSRARSGTEKTRKAAVRLGSFRFVETSNRGGSVHQ